MARRLQLRPVGSLSVNDVKIPRRRAAALAGMLAIAGTAAAGCSDNSDDGSSNVGTVHLLIGMGQSNMSGRGIPTNAEIDPPNPRIFQFGSKAKQITQATVPLDMVDVPSGISPLTFIAREYLQRIPLDEVLLLIPAANGDTRIDDPTAVSDKGIWNAAYTGPSADLYGMAKAQIDAAQAAISPRWPGATTKIVAMFWHQGEGNASTDPVVYASDFDAIVTDLRSHLKDPDLPVVLGGMVPEYLAGKAGALAIRAAHVETPSRVVRTAYTDGPTNGGAGSTVKPADAVHYHRAAVGELGRRMLKAYDRALLNTSKSVPHPPPTVTAQIVQGVLTVDWAQPACRYTGFTVEHSADQATWTPIEHTGVDTASTKSGLTAPVYVRVTTVNENGSSTATAPIVATFGG
jgi:hypothetical protein